MTDAAGSPTGVVNPNEEIVVSIPGDRERRRTRVVIGWTAIDLTDSLLRVPGLAVDSAQQIGRSVPAPTHFPSVKQLASSMGACPAMKRARASITVIVAPTGNRQMLRVFNQAANAAVKASAH
jgi:transposase